MPDSFGSTPAGLPSENPKMNIKPFKIRIILLCGLILVSHGKTPSD
jgi:hypothetical protein